MHPQGIKAVGGIGRYLKFIHKGVFKPRGKRSPLMLSMGVEENTIRWGKVAKNEHHTKLRRMVSLQIAILNRREHCGKIIGGQAGIYTPSQNAPKEKRNQYYQKRILDVNYNNISQR